MSDYTIDAHTSIPKGEYKRLHAAAQAHNTTVGALIAELVHRGLQPCGAPPTCSHIPKPTRNKGGEERKEYRRLTDADRAAIARMYLGGYGDRAIAAFLGSSDTAISSARKRDGIKSRGAGLMTALERERRRPIEELAAG